jgi:hypothetical protein
VRPRFLTEQRVDAPASVDPPLDTGGIEAIEDAEDVSGTHRAPV